MENLNDLLGLAKDWEVCLHLDSRQPFGTEVAVLTTKIYGKMMFKATPALEEGIWVVTSDFLTYSTTGSTILSAALPHIEEWVETKKGLRDETNPNRSI